MQFKLFTVSASFLLFLNAAFATPYGGDLAERATNPTALKRWAEAANKETVNYASLSLLPLKYRQALYSELPKDQQTSLWVAHTENFLASHPELTEDQQAVVQKAIEYFKTPAEDRTLESGKQLEEECRTILGWDQAARLLTSLGPADDESSQGQDTSSKPRLMTKRAPQCECASGDSWCGVFSSCHAGRDGCIQQPDKCGLGWEWDCDGRCD